MAPNNLESQEKTKHDFFNDRTLLFFLLGFQQSRKPIYFIYRGCILLLMTSFTLLAIYAAILVPNKKLRVDALHYCLLAWHSIWGLTARVITHKSLNNVKYIVQYGIYHYKDEDTDEEELRIKNGIFKEIRFKSNFFLILCLSGIATSQIFFPISQFFFVTEDDFVVSDSWMNPYLPHFLYMPFNTRTVAGYSVAHLLDTLCFISLYLNTLCLCTIYISCEVQLKTHLQVLCHSLRNIQRRAVLKYMRKRNIKVAEKQQEDLLSNEHFKSCLYSCLKSNIEHHQALLRLMKEVQPFIGAALLVIFLVAAIIYAANLYLIAQKPRINLMTIYLITFGAESCYTYQVCVFGEEVIEESEHLFESVYAVPWFQYNKQFNRSLQIMMANLLKPMQFQAHLLNSPASIDSYGSILSAMYKIMNLVRQSDKI